MAKDANSLLNYATSLDPAQAAMIQGKQVISETKWDTLTIPTGVIAPQTQFFSQTSADTAAKNFEGPGNLVTSGKLFLAQTLGLVITAANVATTAANIVDFLNRCAVRIQVDQKVMGTYKVHQLSGFGGAYLPSQVAVTAAAAPAGAASNFAITNGVPQSQPFRINPLLIEGQKAFAAFLLAPTGTPITLVNSLDICILIGGLQFQAIQ
jgi:hypothetical protein